MQNKKFYNYFCYNYFILKAHQMIVTIAIRKALNKPLIVNSIELSFSTFFQFFLDNFELTYLFFVALDILKICIVFKFKMNLKQYKGYLN